MGVGALATSRIRAGFRDHVPYDATLGVTVGGWLVDRMYLILAFDPLWRVVASGLR